MEVYRPDLWQSFFVMVGGGSAALTGLVVVAMSLNLEVIAQDATHRYRALGTLAGLTAVFVLCGLVLMGGQNHLAVGIEWLVVSGLAALVYGNGYVQAKKQHGSESALSVMRMIVGTACYLCQMTGAILLVCNILAGIYVAAAATVAYVAFMISGAWLLLVGVYQERLARVS